MLFFVLLLVVLGTLVRWAGRLFFAFGALLLFLTVIDLFRGHHIGAAVVVLAMLALAVMVRRRR